MALNLPSIDFVALSDRVLSQFRNLDPRNPVAWPPIPRHGLLVLLAAAIVTSLWFVWLGSSYDELEAEQATEVKLREDYKNKLSKAVNLDALIKEREQVLLYVTQLERQLPSKAEMDALLSDVNQAGIGRSLQFELFRPGQVAVSEYYAELPIAIRVTGRYHDMGSFASDIANLSRIVTLNNISIAPFKEKEGLLSLDATAKTFRYLDPDEIAAQRKASGGKGGKK
jgi:type IV pilus assembly protein PilO